MGKCGTATATTHRPKKPAAKIEGKHDGAVFLAAIVALITNASAGVQILATVLKANRNTRSTVIDIVLVTPAMRIRGLEGAAFTVAVSCLVSSVPVAAE